MRRFVDQSRDIGRQLRDPIGRRAWRAEFQGLGRCIGQASKLLAAYRPGELALWNCLEVWAARQPDRRAISDENESLTWRQLRNKSVEWGATLQARGVGRGLHVAIAAENSVQLVIALFAIQRANAVAILLDTRSGEDWLNAAIREFDPSFLLVDREHRPKDVEVPHTCVVLALEDLVNDCADRQRDRHGEVCCLGSKPFVWLVTSGTTGKPKGVCISNQRAVLSGYGMATLCLSLKPSDVIFCVLPLSHATALLAGLCATLIAGCSLVTRRCFETVGFWGDVERHGATCLVYVGELARYLLAAPTGPGERQHRLKVAYGNGMALDVWHRFQARFQVPKVLEFYGATELPLALANLAGQPGSVGRTPFGQFSPWRIVRRQVQTGELVRRKNGSCAPCAPDETGELVLLTQPFGTRKSRVSDEFDVAFGREHMQHVSGVVCPRDRGLRTGDIVARDSNGYVRFVDRTFEVFRQNGHNVSTAYLVQMLRHVSGVAAVGVTHVTLPHFDGQMGLAVIVPAEDFSLTALQGELKRLADYMRPRFLRITDQLRVNRSLKFDQATYRTEGIDPGRVADPMYVYAHGRFQLITASIWRDLVLGHFRF